MESTSPELEVDPLERVAVPVGLTLAVGAGAAAGAFASVTAQTLSYCASSLGWVIATALLAMRHLLRGEIPAAAAFLILTVAEPLLWVSGRVGDPDHAVGFLGGALFYVPGMLLLGLAPTYPLAVRGFALLAAAVWGYAALGPLTGVAMDPQGGLAVFGYILISAAFLGVAVVRTRAGRGREPVRPPG